MKRTALLFASAVLSLAQIVPNRYIVEFNSQPAAAVAAAKREHFTSSDRDVQARRTEMEREHVSAEAAIRGMGGSVTHHLYNVVNAMAATMSPQAAARMAQRPDVRSVAPVRRTHVLMDQALNVHRITQVWQTIAGGSSSAGAGIKIGILDTGIDVSHPAFQNFSTTVPSGFPILSGSALPANTNSKVIVSRVYSDLPGGVDNTGTDGSDYAGHGTTVAAIAAGLPQSPGFPGIGNLSGVAPGAWIGSYKVFDDSGNGDSATFLAGLEDAFTDGMNVVNYSGGGTIYNSADENGIEARAIANAVNGGMVVVVAAGNSGPFIGTMGDPAAAPAVIAVGAIENQRWFWYSVTPSGGQPIYAVPPTEQVTFVTGDVTGPLVDVGTVASGDTHACSALPANSLRGRIALIQRGSADGSTCFFETKLDNAQTAGAIGAIVYDNTDRAFFDYSLSGVEVSSFEISQIVPEDADGNALMVSWNVGGATLPAMLVSKADGAALLQLAAANTTVDLDFDGKTALTYPYNQVTDFSSLGPTPGAHIKPDVVAVGDWLVAPTSTVFEGLDCTPPFVQDLVNGCYPPFTFLDTPQLVDFFLGYTAFFDDGAGTSFASPIVAGTVAMLMGARPGLTPQQYRSLVTNSSSEFDQAGTGAVVPPQMAGVGILDAMGALKQGLAANPTSLSFPAAAAGGGSSSSVFATAALKSHADGTVPAQSVVLTNIGPADTFTVTFNSIDGNATPSADSNSFSMDANASHTVTVTLPGGLAAGQYHGFMLVTGTQGQTPLRIPYWYGVAAKTVSNLVLLSAPSSDPSACSDVIDFRLLDASGIPVTPAADPSVTASATNAKVTKVIAISDPLDFGNPAADGYNPATYIAGTYRARIQTGRPDSNGNNVFAISADGSTWDIFVPIDNSGNSVCPISGSGSGTSGVSARAVFPKNRRSPGLDRGPNRQVTKRP